MTDREARDLRVPLDFLGAGRFRAEVYRDDLAARHQLAQETKDVASGEVLQARLAPAGGLLIHIAPAVGRAE